MKLSRENIPHLSIPSSTEFSICNLSFVCVRLCVHLCTFVMLSVYVRSTADRLRLAAGRARLLSESSFVQELKALEREANRHPKDARKQLPFFSVNHTH